MQDLAAWHHTKTSLLTVRPAYRAEWEYQFGRHNQNAMEIDGSNGSKVSKKLWRLNVPNRSRNFWMSSTTWSHPCLGVLANMHIATRIQCHMCYIGSEDILQTFSTCSRAKVWQTLGISDVISEALYDRSGSLVLQHIILKLGS
jgi:hypothetical protein